MLHQHPHKYPQQQYHILCRGRDILHSARSKSKSGCATGDSLPCGYTSDATAIDRLRCQMHPTRTSRCLLPVVVARGRERQLPAILSTLLRQHQYLQSGQCIPLKSCHLCGAVAIHSGSSGQCLHPSQRLQGRSLFHPCKRMLFQWGHSNATLSQRHRHVLPIPN